MRDTWPDIIFKTFSMFLIFCMAASLIAIIVIITCKALGVGA